MLILLLLFRRGYASRSLIPDCFGRFSCCLGPLMLYLLWISLGLLGPSSLLDVIWGFSCVFEYKLCLLLTLFDVDIPSSLLETVDGKRRSPFAFHGQVPNILVFVRRNQFVPFLSFWRNWKMRLCFKEGFLTISRWITLDILLVLAWNSTVSQLKVHHFITQLTNLYSTPIVYGSLRRGCPPSYPNVISAGT